MKSRENNNYLEILREDHSNIAKKNRIKNIIFLLNMDKVIFFNLIKEYSKNITNIKILNLMLLDHFLF